MYFHGWTGVMGFGEEDHKGKVQFSSHYIKGPYCQHDLSLLTLITWLRSRLSGFSTVKLLFLPLLILYFTLQRGEQTQELGVMFHLFEGEVSTLII